jgi:hypothetical protein
MVFTGVTKDSLDDEVRLPYHEYAVTDVNQWVDLAQSGSGGDTQCGHAGGPR